eukprot:COSAG01_NODE_68430_length_264_cov_0.624242_1_plen_21_part_10
MGKAQSKRGTQMTETPGHPAS